MERRCATRRVPEAAEPLSRMRLRTGRELAVVDVSNGGALVEGVARLLPGTHVDVHVMTREGRILVRSRIVRACVCHVTSDVVRYRGALAFDRNVDTADTGNGIPAPFSVPMTSAGNPYPDVVAATGT
jgi:hypothetical protein